METNKHKTTGEGETMTARETMNVKITALKDSLILEMLMMIDGAWEDATPEHRVLRSELLSEWEKRHGGDSVDAIMDGLEACRA